MMTAVTSCVLVLLGAALSQACTCLPAHPQAHYCQSEYVIYATAGNRTEQKEEYRAIYNLTVHKVLKAPNGTDVFSQTEGQNETIVTLSTPLYGSTCGIYLSTGVKYVLGGSISENGDIRVISCGLHLRYNELNKRLMNGFSRKFAQHCDCKITYCMGYRCLPPTADECYHDFWSFPTECSDKFSMCRRKEGKCNWTENRNNKLCEIQARRRRRYRI